MSQSVINDSTLTAIADAINAKAGTTGKMLPSAMPAKIAAIPSGGIPAPVWNQPADWPRIDLVDVRKDPEPVSAYFLCECVEGTLDFGINVTVGGVFDEVDIAADGSVSQIEGSQVNISSGVHSVDLDTNTRYRVFRFRGPAQGCHFNIPSYPNFALVAIVARTASQHFSDAFAINAVGSNYIPKVSFVKYSDCGFHFSQNGWRSTNCVSCFVFDGVTIGGTNAGRNLDTGNNLQVVRFENGSTIAINGAQGPGLFGSNKCSQIDLSAFDFTGATTFSEVFANWSNIRELDLTKAVMVKVVDGIEKRCSPTSMEISFSNLNMCRRIDMSPFDLSKVTTARGAFQQLYNLTDLRMPPFGRGFRVSFNISSAIYLTHESLMSVLESLGDITGSATQTLTIGSENLAKLTDEEKAIATNKGWTLA